MLIASLRFGTKILSPKWQFVLGSFPKTLLLVACGNKLMPSDKSGEATGQSGLGCRLDLLLCNLLIPLIITYSHYGERDVILLRDSILLGRWPEGRYGEHSEQTNALTLFNFFYLFVYPMCFLKKETKSSDTRTACTMHNIFFFQKSLKCWYII